MQKQEFGQGKGKTIAALTKEHDRQIAMGRKPQVKAAPVMASRLPREETKDGAGAIGFENINQKGKQVGMSNLGAKGQWRCATCKQANEMNAKTCIRCKDPKKVMYEQRSNSQKPQSRSNMKPKAAAGAQARPSVSPKRTKLASAKEIDEQIMKNIYSKNKKPGDM